MTGDSTTGPLGGEARTLGGSAESPTQRLRRGTTLGRYIVIERLGGGGMGDVYAAWDDELRRRVALKLLRPGAVGGDRAQVLAEGRALARLRHPHVVTVHDAGEIDGVVFVAMELLEGTDARKWVREHEPSQRQRIAVVFQCAEGVRAAHDAGLVHRDIKPSNVVVETKDGAPRVSVIDFGLAADRATVESAPRGGTRAYMAPEQAATMVGSPLADQWSCALFAVELLTGQRPSADDLAQGRVGRCGPATPVLRRALRIEPSDRFDDMGSFLKALRQATRARRARWLGLGAVIVAGLGGAWSLFGATPDAPCPSQTGDIVLAERVELEDALAILGEPGEPVASALLPAMDRWGSEHGQVRTRVCRATRVERARDESWMTQANTCLDAQKVEFDGVVKASSQVQSLRGWWRLLELIEALPPASSCETEAPVAALTDADRLLDARRAELRALLYSGALSRADEQIEGLVQASRGADSAKLRARANGLAGRTAMEIGSFDQAAEFFQDASDLAARAGAPEILARVLTDRVMLEGVWRGNTEQALAFGELAQSYTNVTENARLRARLHYTLGAVAQKQDDYPRALASCKRSLAELPPEVASFRSLVAARLCIAGAEYRLGNLEAAEDGYRSVEAEIMTKFGSTHPSLPGVLNGLGAVQLEREKPAEAEESFRGALRANRALRGDGDVRTIGAMSNLALALQDQGKAEEAALLLERALTEAKAQFGSPHPLVADLMSSLGGLHLETGNPGVARAWLERADAALPENEATWSTRAVLLGNWGLSYLPDAPDEARPYLERALALSRDALGPDHERVGNSLIQLAECELTARQYRSALSSLRAAEAIYDKLEHVGDSDRARLSLRLSQAIFHTDRSRGGRARARALADRARVLSESGGQHPELSEWLAFLAGH